MYKVLIVEDEETIRKGLIFTMDWACVNCVVIGEASDGEEGLVQIAELRPDIVISDIRMPIKDGLEMIAESIKAFPYSAILLSGYQDFKYAQKAIGLGVSTYLLKPVDFDELKKSLEKITSEIARQREHHLTLQRALQNQSILPKDELTALPTGGRYVKEILEYVQKNYAKHVSLSDIANAIGISPGHLNAKFKQSTQYTFNDYLNRYRVSMAVQMMRSPDNRYKVYEIAEMSGFSDYAYFIKVFKKYTGISPLKFSLQELHTP